jgi:DNA modification methylase
MAAKQSKLFNEPVEEAFGKTIEALEYSRQESDKAVELFGGDVPLSVMKASKGRVKGSDGPAEGSYVESGYIKDMSQPLAKAFSASGRGAARGALSMFPQNICEMAVLLYSKKGDTILDPFAGHNSRMECCARLGRNYAGFDICESFMEFNHHRLEEIRSEINVEVDLFLGDSRHAIENIYKENSADFCITSPPYYDIEYYGPEMEQLGNSQSYSHFMAAMKPVMRAVYKSLKYGAFVAWFVNDFRREGAFVPYHADSMALLQSVGFALWDILIVNLGWTMRAGFTNQIVETKILPKIHEYGIIARKRN